MKKILVALSGGVDSAAAVAILRQQGYDVAGATMLLRDGGEEEAEAARRAAEQLGVRFHCFDLREEFRRRVMEPFIDVYRRGGTPNPCVVCNRQMKFGLFLDLALDLGYDGIATGHYVKKTRRDGRWLLQVARDGAKDQTYMLCDLTQHQLAHSLFPLGEVESKEQTRLLAAQAGLDLSSKRDSQDICFVPDGDYMAWLRARGVVPQKGNFITPEGRILGPHEGLEAYTIGQRRGLGIALGSRAYVLGKRGRDVIVGSEEGLFSRRVLVEQVNWQAIPALTEPLYVQAKLRYTPRTAPALVRPTAGGCELIFDTPQRAVTPGQTAAIYMGCDLMGGGIIASAEEMEEKV